MYHPGEKVFLDENYLMTHLWEASTKRNGQMVPGKKTSRPSTKSCTSWAYINRVMNEAQLEKNGLMLKKYLQMLIKELTKNQRPKIYHKNHKQVNWTSTKNQIIIRKVNSLKEFLWIQKKTFLKDLQHHLIQFYQSWTRHPNLNHWQ